MMGPTGGVAASPNVYVDDERLWLPAVAAFTGLLGGVGLIELETLRLLDVVIALVPALALVARAVTPQMHRWWIFPISMVPPLVLNMPELRTEGVLFLPIASVTFLTLFEPRRWIARTCAAIAALVPVAVVLLTDPDDWGWPFWITGALLGFAFGEIGHRYRDRLIELRSARMALADQAVLDERRRIARDVHDLVGHSLSVLMLQVTAARELVRSDPAEAEAALEDAADVGRASMAEIRRTIGLLRDGDGDGTAPAPTLVDVDELVGQYRSGGIHIELAISGDRETVDRARSIAAFRIVQEALANVSKYGSDRRASVKIDVSDDECRLAITNPAQRAVDSNRHGYGLVGMRERAQSVGGTLNAGHRAGSWTVDVHLPSAISAGSVDDR